MVLATNEEIQILKKSDSEFILYLKVTLEIMILILRFKDGDRCKRQKK